MAKTYMYEVAVGINKNNLQLQYLVHFIRQTYTHITNNDNDNIQ